MNIQKIRKILPFALVFVLLLGSVAVSRAIHAKPSDVFPVNTAPDKNGEVHSVRVFESINSVMVIDFEKRSKKKKIPANEYDYNQKTTRLTFKNPLPFENPVVHIEGKAVQPERFCLYDFDGETENLLVLLDDREATENLEYTFDRESRTITFRSDIHPESDGQYFIMYETADGATHSFGNWIEDTDRLATLQWQWMARTKDAPPLVMKDRSRTSNKKISKEAGFKINLPKGDSTFISEQMENGERRISVMRWYDKIRLMVECKDTPFLQGGETKAEEAQIIRFGKQNVTRQKIFGTETSPDGSEKSVPLTMYEWQADGTFYQLTVGAEKEDEAERFLREKR